MVSLFVICVVCTVLVLGVYCCQFLVYNSLARRLLSPEVLAYVSQDVPRELIHSENRFNDFLVRRGRKAPAGDNLLCIGIDDDSLSVSKLDLEELYDDLPKDGADFQALSLMANHFPWSREVYAILLDKLIAAGARVVVFDIVFLSELETDAAFREALERHQDKVVVGSDFNQKSLPSGMEAWAQSVPSDSLIPATTPQDDRIGFVNFWPDAGDGVLRAVNYRLRQNEVFLSLAAAALKKADFTDRIPPGLDGKFIRWADPAAASFRPRPLLDAFAYWKNNFGNGGAVKDKIVMVGYFGARMHDTVKTPFDELPGPVVHLQAINAAMQGAFVRPFPFWLSAGVIALGGFLGFQIISMVRYPVRQFAALAACGGLIMVLSWVAFNRFSLQPVTISPLLSLWGSGLVSLVYQWVAERVERRRMRLQFERYMSKNVVRELLDNPKEFEEARKGVRRNVTVLFSDLRGFTSIMEGADARELVAQLNEYLSVMVECVFKHRGTLDKFIGDAVMAVWGNVQSFGPEEDARRAVSAALEMRAELAKLNARWAEQGRITFRFGIGLNYGEVITGDMGSAEKSEFTVIGDPVNLASRMEGLTKEYGVDLLIGEDVANLVGEHFVLQSIDLVRVKGKGRATEVFAVHQPKEVPVDEALQRYVHKANGGVHLYRNAAFAAAKEKFVAALEAHPSDPVSRLYVHRCDELIANPPGSGWDAVFVMKTK